MWNSVILRGQWMYPVGAGVYLIGLVRSGLLNLIAFDVTDFALDDANDAVAHAAANGGPFKATAIRP
ncbi:hypothetical protein [Streptomyces sp. NPDC058086]|uniref:hypothetical protein n=1 Tax=Streptomyces sp. NPDC058086 TaxID=3346334 RepID=UPI0036E48DB8